MAAPLEIITGPADVYAAPTGEAFPAINAAPAGNWALIGTVGDADISEEGVTIRNTQTIAYTRVLGASGPVKAFRPTEDIVVEFVSLDAQVENYRKLLAGGPSLPTLTTTAGPPGHKAIPLLQGQQVYEWALLVRATRSPYGTSNAWYSQWELPLAVIEGSPETVYRKDVAVGVRFVFRLLEDATNGFGTLRVRHAT